MDEFENEKQNFEEKKKDKKTRKEKSGSGIGKFFKTVFLAIVFGVVAAMAFQTTTKFTEKRLKKADSQISKYQDETEDKKEDQVKEEKPEKKEEKDKEPEKKEESVKNSASHPEMDEPEMRIAKVVEEAMPSIVAITNTSIQEVRSFYGRGIQQYKSDSAGSGIIVGKNDKEIIIVTNAHVVDNADTLTVCFIDEEAYEAHVKGTDSKNDLAVIGVNLSDVSGDTLGKIKVATVGSSDDLVIGETVVAIGNAMGYGQSVTAGIVSALDRSIEGVEQESNYIQTDAAINPGNSGGALLNLRGEVVGINSAKLSNTKIEGMCYAIPISAVEPIMENLINLQAREKVDSSKAGYLGISGFSVTKDVSQAYGIPEGIYISDVSEGAAADKGGIQKGDVIITFDGISVDSIKKLKERLEYYKAGEVVDIVVARADDGEYKEKTLKVTLDDRAGTSLDEEDDEKSSSSDDSDSWGEQEEESQSSDSGVEDRGEENAPKEGSINIGGNEFNYSIPGDLFGLFGW